MADSPAAIRADADRIDAESRRFATTRPWAYHLGQILARFLRWRAADLEAYATPAGRRRSARRWFLAGIVFAALSAGVKLAYHWWHWPDLSPIPSMATFVAVGLFLQQRGWADGYEARRRDETADRGKVAA